MRLKRTLAVIEIVIIVITMMFSYSNKGIYAQTTNEKQTPVKVGVLLYRFDDVYISEVRQSLVEIQKKNEGKVEFTFYDGKDNQSIQNQTIDTLLQSKSVDLLLLNLVDVKSTYKVINRIKEYNIPVILFNREPLNMNAVQSYSKACFVGTNAAQAGTLQGKILINAWNKNKKAIDKNGDNILQYIMLIGENNNKEAIERTEYSVLTINDAGIKTQQLESAVCNWNRELAKESFEPFFLHYYNRIEAIISNNDEMAIGAVEALQGYGYNKGDKSKNVIVVGIDGLQEAKDLIDKGYMTATIIHNQNALADAIYNVGMKLVNNLDPLENTNYKFENGQVIVPIPYSIYE